jgi:hypothetical protein
MIRNFTKVGSLERLESAKPKPGSVHFGSIADV